MFVRLVFHPRAGPDGIGLAYGIVCGVETGYSTSFFYTAREGGYQYSSPTGIDLCFLPLL